ncbi:MAG TPA: S8 family serine peptidase, partial [Steroidobacteraceae bacterium]
MESSRGVAILAALLALSALAADALPGAASSDADVIIILRDQVEAVPATRDLRAARTAALALSRAPLLAELERAQARKVHAFNMINAVAATVTSAEATQLAAHPLVQAVVPDAVIRLLRPKRNAARAAAGATTGAGPGTAGSGALCNTLEPEALQLTHTAFLDPTIPQAQQVIDGEGHTVTGRGVKVAFLADGLDPTLPGYVRPDGTNVFIDYQDFSGDSPGTPTAGGEAFGDSSSIAAQDYPNGKLLTFDLDSYVLPGSSLPAPCKIRIRGMAPDASLVGLKIFSNLGYTTTSGFVQAVEYAVLHDDVDIINESFSSFYNPDNDNDPISLANEAAVKAGVTVVGITYDGGSAGTFESSGTDPWMIAVGASTQYRLYAQTQAPLGSLTKPGAGYLDNNISALSSAGFAQTGTRTTDVVAPGDLGWALCSLDQALYYDCGSNNSFDPAAIQEFGGTSESAPLTSGEAALIIQAYRSTHGGASPSPALVKSIIMSTATDLGAPASEQGAGLIDALAAVRLALSIKDGHGGAKGPGGLLTSPTSTGFTDNENAAKSVSFSITNTGSTPQRIAPHLQTLSPAFAGATVSVELDAAKAPQFIDPYGYANAYVKHTFSVPAGAQHLDAAIAFVTPAGSAPLVQLVLLDPLGRLATYSLPQGTGSGYGHVDVVSPTAGLWTAVIFAYPPSVAPALTYSGPVQFTWSAERFVDLGSVTPASVELAGGASATFSAKFNMPSTPGDLAAGIRFERTGGLTPGEIPVTLRTLIPVGPTGGSFSGTLTGGNGRAQIAPTQIFAFDVTSPAQSMSLTLNIADSGDPLVGILVDPNGMPLSVGGNADLAGDPEYGFQLSRFNPQLGRWRFLLLQNFTTSGNQTSLPFVARIAFNSERISAPALPDAPSSTVSASGAALVVPVHVTNTGVVTQAYFADARLRTPAQTSLTALPLCTVVTLPGTCSEFVLPTEVSGAVFTARSPAPITMDVSVDVGASPAVFVDAPDIYARKIGPTTVAASISEPELPYSAWVETPALIGPYGPAGALSQPVSTSAEVWMLPFDPAVSS